MTHLGRDELVRWRDGGAEADRERIVDHLAECADCVADYAELMRTRPAESLPSVLDPAAFVRRGHAALRPAASPGRRLAWRLVPLAAAAAFVVALAGPRLWVPTRPEPILRGADFTELTPQGPVRPPIEFRWRTPVKASRYLVEVYDADRQPLWRGEAAGASLSAGPDLERRLQPGREYRWLVTALDARGQTLSVSPLTSFRLTLP
jgi:hypothetical protein